MKQHGPLLSDVEVAAGHRVHWCPCGTTWSIVTAGAVCVGCNQPTRLVIPSKDVGMHRLGETP